jgi:5-methylcytosine-specific restriction protein A
MPRDVPEWLGKTASTKIPPRVRERIFLRAGKVCHLCSQPIQIAEPWDADHVTALINGGANAESNLAPAHKRCHREKTGADVAEKSKVAAIRQKHNGTTRSKQSFPKIQKPERAAKLDFTQRRNVFTGEPIS